MKECGGVNAARELLPITENILFKSSSAYAHCESEKKKKRVLKKESGHRARTLGRRRRNELTLMMRKVRHGVGEQRIQRALGLLFEQLEQLCEDAAHAPHVDGLGGDDVGVEGGGHHG